MSKKLKLVVKISYDDIPLARGVKEVSNGILDLKKERQYQIEHYILDISKDIVKEAIDSYDKFKKIGDLDIL